MLLERIVDESGIHHDNGVFSVHTSVDRLPEAIFRFGQALTRVYDLTLLSRSNVGSTFYDDLADCLSALVDDAKMERDYQPEVPNADAYPVDYRIEGKSGDPAIRVRRTQPGQGAFGDDHARATSTGIASRSNRSSSSRTKPRSRESILRDSPMWAGT